MTDANLIAITRARLRGAGLTEARIAVVLERATRLVEQLHQLSELDPELPEPALSWEPLDRPAP